jgi:YbbR domain-containing protein
VHRLRQNLLFKILSLAGAIALFYYVQKQQATESPEYFLPLELAPPPGLTVVEPSSPRQVRVKLAGPAHQIEALDETQIRAIVDLAGKRKGQYPNLPVEILLPPTLQDQVQLVYRAPTRVTVRLDQVTRRQFQVEPVILSQPPSGYSLGLPKLDPPSVEVSGLSEAVGRVRGVQAVVAEVSSTDRLDQIVRVNVMDERGKEVGDGLQIRPPTVRIRAPIERSIWSKPLYVDPDVGPLPPGKRLRRLTVTPDRVVVTGPDEVLSRLWLVRTRPIRVTPDVDRIDTKVTLQAPPGVREVEPATVRVEVELEGVAS